MQLRTASCVPRIPHQERPASVNFVFSCRIAPYAVFRKQRWVASAARPGKTSRHRFRPGESQTDCCFFGSIAPGRGGVRRNDRHHFRPRSLRPLGPVRTRARDAPDPRGVDGRAQRLCQGGSRLSLAGCRATVPHPRRAEAPRTTSSTMAEYHTGSAPLRVPRARHQMNSRRNGIGSAKCRRRSCISTRNRCTSTAARQPVGGPCNHRGHQSDRVSTTPVWRPTAALRHSGPCGPHLSWQPLQWNEEYSCFQTTHATSLHPSERHHLSRKDS